MGAFSDSYWEDHPMTYTDPDDGVVKTQVGGVGVPLKEYLGEDKEEERWTAYRNVGRIAVYLGENSIEDVADRSKAKTFSTKDECMKYIKDINELLVKYGEPRWIPVKV